MPKILKRDKDESILELHLKRNNTSLRTSIPVDFIREKKLRDEDILIIPKREIKVGRLKMEFINE